MQYLEEEAKKSPEQRQTLSSVLLLLTYSVCSERPAAQPYLTAHTFVFLHAQNTLKHFAVKLLW